MGLFEHFPYTNFHDLNLNWIIGKIKHIETAETNTAESAEAAAASAAAAQLSADAAGESAAEADASASGIAGKVEQIDLNTARIDNILVQGTPTEGNAELIDIRVGYKGKTYTTAGNAVRAQASDLNDHLEYLSMRTTNLIDIFNANVLNIFPNTGTGKIAENEGVRSIIIPVDSANGTTIALRKDINSRFTVTTLSSATPSVGDSYLSNTNIGNSATAGTVTIDESVQALLVWYWFNDTADADDVLESLTVVYGSSTPTIRSRIPYMSDYEPRAILEESPDLSSDANLQTGSFYINRNDLVNAPMGITSGAFFVTNESANGISNRRAVLQTCYVQSPVYLRSSVWRRMIDAVNKNVYTDWNCVNKSWFNTNVMIFGDSITAGYPQQTNDSYHWWSYLQKYFDFSNFAQSGAGIIYENAEKSGVIFADQFNDTNQNYLMIFMGTNDYGNDMPLGTVSDAAGNATVCAGLKYMIETVMNKTNRISIIGVLPLNRSDFGTAADNWAYGTANNAGYTLSDLCDAMKTIYESYGIPVIDNRTGVFQRYNVNALTVDGLHPTLEGYRKLSQHLGGELMKIISPI